MVCKPQKAYDSHAGLGTLHRRSKPDTARVKAESFGDGDCTSTPATNAEAEAKLTRCEEERACPQGSSKPTMERAGSVVAGPPGATPVEKAAAVAVTAVESANAKATTNVKAGELQAACS